MNARNPPELRECPRCGSTTLYMRDLAGWEIDCACGIHFECPEFSNDEDKTVAEWNRRSDPASAEGWQMVPKDPTVDMTAAAYADQPNVINGGFAQAYRAMLAASPPPPSADGVEG